MYHFQEDLSMLAAIFDFAGIPHNLSPDLTPRPHSPTIQRPNPLELAGTLPPHLISRPEISHQKYHLQLVKQP